MSKKILIIVGDFVEDYEIMVPFQMMQLVGFEPCSVSPGKKAGEFVKTAIHDFEGHQTYTEKVGHNFSINYDFEAVDVGEFDGLYIPGGRAPEFLALNPRVLQIIKEFDDAQKPIASICHGPICLVGANIVKNRTLTAYPTVSTDIKFGGGNWQEAGANFDNVVVDKNLVTSPAWTGDANLMREFFKLLGLTF